MSELDLRVGDDDRERVVGTLQRHAHAGRLDPVELDERLEAAIGAKTFRELQRLTVDLPDETRTPQALRRRKVGELREHVGFWITVSVICVAVWAMTGADYFWPVWPVAFIGLTVVLNALSIWKGDEDDGRAPKRC